MLLNLFTNNLQDGDGTVWEWDSTQSGFPESPPGSSGVLWLFWGLWLCGSLWLHVCLSEPPSPCPCAVCAALWQRVARWLLAILGTIAGEDGLNQEPTTSSLIGATSPLFWTNLLKSFVFPFPLENLPQLGGQISPFCNSTKANLASVFPYLSAKDPIIRCLDKSLQRELFPL